MAEAGRAAYLVLDLVNDVVHPDGRSGFAPEAARRQILPRTAAFLARVRAAGLPVGYVRIGFSPGYPEVPPGAGRFAKARDNGLFGLDDWGTAVHADVAAVEGDFDIVKHRVGPFYGTRLEPLLSALGTDTLIVSGVSTNAVVQSTVREGSDRDFRMILLEDCCSAADAAEHEAAISTLQGFATITISGELDLAAFQGN